MSNRITKGMMQTRLNYLNQLTGAPLEPWTRTKDGRNVANLGNYYLSSAYGGYAINRMSNEGGGVSVLLNTGHRPMREIFDLLGAYIEGIETAKRESI